MGWGIECSQPAIQRRKSHATFDGFHSTPAAAAIVFCDGKNNGPPILQTDCGSEELANRLLC